MDNVGFMEVLRNRTIEVILRQGRIIWGIIRNLTVIQ